MRYGTCPNCGFSHRLDGAQRIPNHTLSGPIRTHCMGSGHTPREATTTTPAAPLEAK